MMKHNKEEKLSKEQTLNELTDDALDQVTGGTDIVLEKSGSKMQIGTGNGPVRIIVPDDVTTFVTQTNTQAAERDLVRSFEAHITSSGTSIYEPTGNVNVGIDFIVPTGEKADHYFTYYVADNGNVEKFTTNIP